MAANTGNGQQGKTMPKDGQVIVTILKDMGITDYEPQVITQLLEFTYRYLTTTLEDAKVYSQHAGKRALDNEDIQLAVSMQLDKNFTTPPPRDLLMEVARGKNTTPLPQIKPHCGIRLPPDRYCMTSCNYELKTPKKQVIATAPVKTPLFQQQLSPQIKPQIKRTITAIPRTQTFTPPPKPVIKFSSGTGPSNVSVTTAMDVDEPPASYIKRKHPDDD